MKCVDNRCEQATVRSHRLSRLMLTDSIRERKQHTQRSIYYVNLREQGLHRRLIEEVWNKGNVAAVAELIEACEQLVDLTPAEAAAQGLIIEQT